MDRIDDLPASDLPVDNQRKARPGKVQGFRLRPKPMFKPMRIPKTRLQFKRKLRDRGQAEHQMCKAIAALGELAGIDVGMGLGPEDMDQLLIEAAHQCHFDDAEFLDGPCCFEFVKTVVDADILKLQADVVVQGLASYIRKHAGREAIQAADRQVFLIDAAFAWLRKSARRA